MSDYHFIQELREQPAAVRETVVTQWDNIARLVGDFPQTLNRVVMVGCGDPYFASEAAIYPFERWARLPTEATDALEFRFWREALVDENTLVLLISQSGKTIQVVEAARLARARGATVVGVTNSPDSPLAELCDHLLFTAGGPSYSFPTRTTTAAAAALFSLALQLGAARGRLSEEQASELRHLLSETVPALMEQALDSEPAMQRLAEQWQDKGHFAFHRHRAGLRGGAGRFGEDQRDEPPSGGGGRA